MDTVLVNIETGFVLWFAIGAAFVAGLARGFSGFGAGLIFMPLASATLGPQTAAPVLMLVDSTLIVPYVARAWRDCDKKNVGLMTIGAYIGVPIGTAILTLVDELVMRWALIVVIVLLLALLVSGWRYRGVPRPPLTIGVGTMAGFLNGAAQVGGPPAIAYWLGSPAPARTVRANLVVFLFLSAFGTFVAYLASGLLDARVLSHALVIGPFYAGGLLLGSRLFGLASEGVFRRICYGLIALAAITSLPVLDGILR